MSHVDTMSLSLFSALGGSHLVPFSSHSPLLLLFSGKILTLESGKSNYRKIKRNFAVSNCKDKIKDFMQTASLVCIKSVIV